MIPTRCLGLATRADHQFVYQPGNFLASYNATLQASFAVSHHHNCGLAMAPVIGVVAVLIVVLMIFGPEAKNVSMAHS